MANTGLSAPYAQTLELAFDLGLGASEVQAAPLWEGSLRFVPDSTSDNPTEPADVLESRYLTWSVTGDLVLRASAAILPRPRSQ